MTKKLLVVVDMQKDFVDGCLGTKEAQSIVEPVIQYVKNFDGDVAYTLDTHDENYMDTQEGKKLPVAHCIRGTDGWKIVNGLDDALFEADALGYQKNTFGSTDLANDIKNARYNDIEFCGVCTGICVISNVLMAKAYVPEAKITVLSDLCACVTPESHETALSAMATCQIDIADSKDM